MTNDRQLREARDRFVALLEDDRSLESEWQSLFTECPFILSECLPLGIGPQRLIPCEPFKEEADFISSRGRRSDLTLRSNRDQATEHAHSQSAQEECTVPFADAT